MIRISAPVWSVIALSGWLLSGVVHAQVPPASDEVLLQVTKQEVDEDAAGRNPKSHAEALAKQLQVPVKTVEDLRAAKQGWGEITIRMALAQELTKTDSTNFPTMEEALKRVGDLRASKKGWGLIAKELKLNLGPVVSEAQRVRQELRAQAKSEVTGSGAAGKRKPPLRP